MIAALDQLIANFNRRSLDLPDGLFTRHSQFLLNGVPFEALLGRSPTDPLVLMLARGPAGYRFALKALQHAIPDGVMQRGENRTEGAERHEGDRPDGRLTGQLWLSGHYRGTSDAAELLIDYVLVTRGGSILRAEVTLAPTALDKVRDARLRP